MSDPVVLRPATPDDAPAIAATIASAFAQYRGRLVPESGAFRETEEGIAAELAKGAGAIVAERNGEMLGCVMIKVMEGDLYFGRLAVVPEARGLGLARRLVAAVEADARARGLAGVRLGVRVVLTENQRLFRSLGYVETGREAHPGFDYPTSINMRKHLLNREYDKVGR
ncbi:GNAT family N-acetyltransferase [Reyranella sp.]|jgi:ribosomal protein S18 acetylase RimI-like enzyme|uniref:GNAT family N-acetyltransferase n=1 Tax=Reyranella sp. TaxID=1929291 RepID=UPI002F92E014